MAEPAKAVVNEEVVYHHGYICVCVRVCVCVERECDSKYLIHDVHMYLYAMKQ